LRALIDRVGYLDGQIQHPRNAAVLFNLRMCLLELELRACERHGRDWPPSVAAATIEHEQTCPRCGHIGCYMSCAAALTEAGRSPQPETT
jgi:hypothetical protein